MSAPPPPTSSSSQQAAEPSSFPTTIVEAPLNTGDTCMVRWRNGERNLQASVLERRRVGHRKRPWKQTQNDPDEASFSSLKANQLEYYVHYEGHDRRLDEWISLDKFVLSTLERCHTPTTMAADNPKDLSLSASNSEETQSVGDAVGKDDSAISAAAASANQSDAASDKKKTATSNNAADTEAPALAPPASRTTSFSTSSAPTMGGNWHGASGDPALAAFEKEHEETTRLKNIAKIWMGTWLVEAWYYSPFPDEYSGLDCLYVCEFCLSYCRKVKTYRRHLETCPHKKPPGKRIYKDDQSHLAVYELDGEEHPAYCQKLCLLAKLFLDHKTLYYNVTPFFFYVVCRVDPDTGHSHIVGYFSKEKHSLEGYNLACILTFPQYQKAGYGKFIISLSYELTKRQGLTGSPEKPLSDLGKVSYRSYWKHVLFHLLANHDTTKGDCNDISIGEMSAMTGIKNEDILSTLQQLDMIKVWKGQHVVYVEQSVLQQYLDQKKKFRLCNPDCLDWQAPPPSADEKQH